MKALVGVPILAAACLAGAVSTQSGWVDGPGIPGPVTSWDDSFFDCNGIAWLSVPGRISLASVPLDSPVRHDLSLSFDGCYSAAVGDANGDGLNDLAATAFNGNALCLWISNGQGGWVASTVKECEAALACAFADVDSDGALDLLLTTYTPGSVRLFRNLGGEVPQWQEQVICTSLDGMHDIVAFDIDRDGDNDIAAASAEDDQVVWWRNDGGSPITWVQQTVGAIDYPCRLAVTDIDGDWNTDISAAGFESDQIRVWYGSGGSMPTWTGQNAAAAIDGAHGVEACDVDGDGDMDLVCAAMNGNSLFWLRNEGGSPVAWTSVGIATFSAGGCSGAADIDGDGDYDVTSGSFGTAGAAWWENQGDGTSWIKHQLVSALGTISLVRPGDVDTDGDLDLVCCGFSGDRLCWVEATSFVGSGWLESAILDTGCHPLYSSIDWAADVPAGTGLVLKFRSSDNPSSMGEWSAPFTIPSETSGQVDRYFQYRLEFSTTLPTASPVMDTFTLGYDPLGIDPGDEGGMEIEIVGGNPSADGLSILLTNPGGGTVDLRVFDICGRLVSRYITGVQPGASILLIGSLPPGLYVAEARNPAGGSVRARVTVI